MRLKNRRAKRARKNQRERERESRRRKESVLRTPLSLSLARAERKRRLFFRAAPSRVSVVLFISKQNGPKLEKKCGSRLETLNPKPTNKRSALFLRTRTYAERGNNDQRDTTTTTPIRRQKCSRPTTLACSSTRVSSARRR